MMTNEQHDNAWLDVMRNRVPNMDTCLELLTKSVYYRNMLEYYKEAYRMEEISHDDYVDVLRFIGNKQGFVKND